MKNKGIIIMSIIILSILVLVIAYIMVSLITGKARFFKFDYSVSNELVVDKYLDTTSKDIEITADMSDIHIYSTDDLKTRVVIFGDEEKTTLNDETNLLRIKSTTKKCIGICFNNEAAKIEVYLPKTFSNSITIKNAYGDVDLEDFREAIINIDSDCGDVKVIEGKNVSINNAYGDIKLKKAIEANIKASAGDIDLESLNKGFIKNSYGDIKITKIDGSFDIESNCGDVTIEEVFLKENSNIKNDLGNIKIGKTNEIYIDAKTSLGDTKIHENYNKSDITLKLTNNCGDITVKN